MTRTSAVLLAASIVFLSAAYASVAHARFLQVDPVGYGDQMNPYVYIGNDPLNGTDPTGKYKCDGGRGCDKIDAAQQRMAGAYDRGAATLDAAAADLDRVNAAHAAGDTSATVADSTKATMGAFNKAVGPQTNPAAAMRETAGRFRAAAAGLRSDRPLIRVTMGSAFDKQVTRFRADEPFGAVPNSGQVYMNNNYDWGDASGGDVAWGIGHDALHAEAGVRDQYLGGRPVYARDPFRPDPPDLARVNPLAAMMNPDNILGFAFGR